MGQLLNWRAMFLRTREYNMRRRAKYGFNAEYLAELITLPIVISFERSAKLLEQSRRLCGSRAVAL